MILLIFKNKKEGRQKYYALLYEENLLVHMYQDFVLQVSKSQWVF